MPANIGAELQQLPLAFLISAPLTEAIKGQALAAMTTADFINNVLLEDKPLDPNDPSAVGASARMVSFSYDSTVTNPADPSTPIAKRMTLSVPLMSMVHTPNLRIEDMTIAFEFKIRDVQSMGTATKVSGSTSVTSGNEFTSTTKAGVKGNVGIGKLFGVGASASTSQTYSSNFKFTATGSATYQRSERHQTDRSATYKMNLNVKEQAPEGFLRVLEILNSAITNVAADATSTPSS